MYRKIISKYPGKCAKCGNTIHRGDAIYWQKGSRSIFHEPCFGLESPKPQPSPTGIDPGIGKPEPIKAAKYDFQIDIAELKKRMVQLLKGDESFIRNPRNRKESKDAGISEPTSWNGYNKQQMLDWIASGFKSEAFKDLHEISPPMRKRRKMVYAEEGELQVDLVLSGFDQPFIQWTKRETAPGLSVDIETSFSAGMDNRVIAEYQNWIARMLYTLETEGIDLDVNIANRVRGGISGDTGENTTRINVKREQEATDFSRWSVMFSPGGFRGLMFLAKVIGADHHKAVINSNFGIPIGNSWDLQFDPETRKLRVLCNRAATDFPASEMTEKLRTILQTFK
jgi:hypothetical protein